MWQVRTAHLPDAAPLAELAEGLFREAFSACFPAHTMDAYCAEAFSAKAQGRELADPAMTTLIAEDGGGLAAYAQLREGDAPPYVVPAPSVQLKRIYVRRASHGTGLAVSLLGHAAERARQAGARSLWLAVWQQNARAIRFYERQGLTIVGAMEFVMGDERQQDHVMAASVETILARLG